MSISIIYRVINYLLLLLDFDIPDILIFLHILINEFDIPPIPNIIFKFKD